jgi:ribosomal protein L44E
MARRPLTPFVYLALAIVSLVGPVAFMLANPFNQFAFAAVVPGSGLALILLVIFSNTFYFEGGSKPSFFERVRVRKCPYCGAWAVHAVERKLQDVETESTVSEGMWPTADGVLGTKSPGMDKPMEPATMPVSTLKFEEDFKCNKCGKTWTRTVTHEERPEDAFGNYSAQLREQGYED